MTWLNNMRMVRWNIPCTAVLWGCVGGFGGQQSAPPGLFTCMYLHMRERACSPQKRALLHA